MRLRGLISLFLMVLVLSSIYSVAEENTNITGVNVLNELLSNPKVYIAVFIQFVLGLALGYFSLKVLKYIVALILIIILGVILSVWSIGGSIYNLLAKIYGSSSQILKIVESIASTLGLLIIGPVAVGFIVGVIIAWVKG
ncbi:hypothetical protein [Desulfurococcus amylolyticus]|uniref:Uncharacterized protein n=1 Tax=Desulfurococcus amylolyticus DSM 16532 TaxID=768672 RepID=I3XRA0_DESAM|nr:hypothetical protein [Desulfurococcus amylolyticus]AFL66474.1 hypothetical protein Desfe_0573 [Desulfurococcus amylolyticus DSM 16532]